MIAFPSRKSKCTQGQSLFEVVMALAITTIIVVGIVTLTSTAVRNTDYSKNKTLSARYVQEGMEWLRSERDTDFVVFSGHAATPIWCMPTLGWSTQGSCGAQKITDTVFTREISFEPPVTINNKTLIEATVKVSWEDGQGIHEVKSVTELTDWRQD